MSSTKRRQFTPEFKASAVALVLEKGQSIPQVARDLDLVDSVFRRWINQARAGQERPVAAVGPVSLTAEQAELQQLRRENQILRMERDILKKATAFFAKESS
jgi:transposase-like protein